MHVLVVDDHGTNRKLLRVQLEAESFTVSEAAEGREALELLEKEPVDVVVSDILMPGMDGFRFCRELRANPRLRHLPFIIYTSTYTSAADEKLALKAGADRFVRKPCPASELLALIRDAAAQAGRRTPQLSQLPDESGSDAGVQRRAGEEARAKEHRPAAGRGGDAEAAGVASGHPDQHW